MRRSLLALALSAWLAPALGAQKALVLVVDPNAGPAYPYRTLQGAIDLAREGDVLLLEDGSSYTGTIDGKSLVLQARNPFGAELKSLVVRNLGPDQFLAVRDCNGLVTTVEDCAGPVEFDSGGYGAVTVERSEDVVLTGLDVWPGWSWLLSCEGGLTMRDARVFVYASRIEGQGPESLLGCSDRPGIVMTDSDIYLHGSTVLAGAFGFMCGKTALSASGACTLEVVDSEFLDATDPSGPCPGTVVGVVPTVRPGTARSLATPSHVHEQEDTVLHFSGEPGDELWLAISPEPWTARRFPSAGWFHGEVAATRLVRIGTVPAGGTLDWPVHLPSFPGFAIVRSWYFQPYAIAPSGLRQLGTPTQVHVFDPAY